MTDFAYRIYEIVAYLIKYDNSNDYIIFIKMSYMILSKYGLIVPQ